MRGVGIALEDLNSLPGNRQEGSGGAATDPMAERVARLTAGQLDCLRLIDQHLSSKEIAAELGISPHTVDQRVRQVLQILGVDTRKHAARIVAQYSGPYQRLIHQSPYIPADPQSGQSEAAVGNQIRHADRAGGGRRSRFPYRAEAGIIPTFPAFAVRNEEQPPE